MPLPVVSSGKAVRCGAMCKATGMRCCNPAAYGAKTCRYHGARRSNTVKRGASHPQYRHGRETLEAKSARSRRLMELRELEALSFALAIAKGGRWRGRKPQGHSER